MYKYNGYNPKNNKHVQKYRKSHYKIVNAVIDIEYYENTLKPLCDKLGVSVSSFTKEAVMEKISNMNEKE